MRTTRILKFAGSATPLLLLPHAGVMTSALRQLVHDETRQKFADAPRQSRGTDWEDVGALKKSSRESSQQLAAFATIVAEERKRLNEKVVEASRCLEVAKDEERKATDVVREALKQEKRIHRLAKSLPFSFLLSGATGYRKLPTTGFACFVTISVSPVRPLNGEIITATERFQQLSVQWQMMPEPTKKKYHLMAVANREIKKKAIHRAKLRHCSAFGLFTENLTRHIPRCDLPTDFKKRAMVAAAYWNVFATPELKEEYALAAKKRRQDAQTFLASQIDHIPVLRKAKPAAAPTLSITY